LAVRLFVGNLSYNTTEAELRAYFGTVGNRGIIIYGSDAGKEALAGHIQSILASAPDPAKVRSDASTMRLDMARHKPPSGPLDIKLGPGGLVDLEFAVHTLQLTHGVGIEPGLEFAIAELSKAALIDPAFDADLRLLTRMLVVMRLVAPDGNEPPERSRSLVASLCGYPDWDALLAAHDAARQRIGELWRKVREG